MQVFFYPKPWCALQISSVWQAAVSVVHSYPHTTDLIASVDALAEEEGEPSGEAFKFTDADADDTVHSQGEMQQTSACTEDKDYCV